MSALDELPPPRSALDDLPPPTSYNPSAGGANLQVGPFDTGIHIPEWADRTLAGAGKAGVDLVRGSGQWLGLENRQDVAESRKLDAPLMNTTAGKVGNVAGAVGFGLPAMLIPGANGVAGAAAVGAGMGALQPSTSTAETAENIGLGGALGGVGGAVGNKVANWAAARDAARKATADTEASLNAERDAVLSKAKDAGYVVPPTAANANAVNTALESVSGKAATRQTATAKNQQVTNDLIRQDLNLPTNAPINQSTLENVRAQAGKVYDAVKKVGNVQSDPQYIQDLQSALVGSPQLNAAYGPGIGGQADQKLKDLVNAVMVADHNSSDMVDAVKLIRSQAKGNYKSAFSNPNGAPDTLALARGQQDVADAMENLLKRHLQQTGQAGLADAWDSARTTIAKTHSVEAALNGNNVNAANLAAQARKGKPMSDGMDLAAQFGTHFPEVAAIPKSGAGVSKLAAVGALMEGGAGAYLHSPRLMAAAAATTAAPYAVRGAILSRPGQALLASPNYAPGSMGTAGLKTLNFAGKSAPAAGAIPLSQLIGIQGQ